MADYTVGETRFILRPVNNVLFNSITLQISTTKSKPSLEIVFDYNELDYRISENDYKKMLTEEETELLESHMDRLREKVREMNRGKRRKLR